MTDGEITSVILRFRDLSVAEGQTLALHKQRIDQHRAVWWGWWANGNERALDGTFRALVGLANEHLDVFLYDSGHVPDGKLYRAQCTDIEWDHKSPEPGPIPSPDPELTPHYYVEKPCKAWFKFTSIEPADPELIRDFSYVSIPDFFTDKVKPYVKFDHKRIFALEELFHPRATMWFIRPALATDLDYRIEVLGRDIVEPKDFPERVLDLTGTSWLWLSDLHFGGGGEHQFPKESSVNEVTLTQLITRLIDDWNVPVGALLLSGDMTWRADDDQFDQAAGCVGEISQLYGLRDTQRMVVPGNHDLRFSDAPEDADAEVKYAPAHAREPYSRFYKGLFYLEPNAYLSSGRRMLLDSAVPIEVALLNSSRLEQVRQPKNRRKILRFQGQGFLGDDQLADAARQLGWQEGDQSRALRIAVLHHHVVPVSYAEWVGYGVNYDTVLDAGRFMEWIVRHRVDIVLHGHQHDSFVARLSRPIPKSDGQWHSFYVLGMGSTGVDQSRRAENVPNMFGVIDFESRDRVRIKYHSIFPNGKSELIGEHVLDLAAH